MRWKMDVDKGWVVPFVEQGNARMQIDQVTTSQPWFDVRSTGDGVFIIEEPFHVERVKSYLIVGTDRAALIDTGTGVGDMCALVEEMTDRPVVVVQSHAHWDHIGGSWRFEEVWIHEAEVDAIRAGVGNVKMRRALADDQLTGPLPAGFDRDAFVILPAAHARTMADGATFDLGDVVLEAIHGPGHSPGGVSLLDRARGYLFSTDVAYAGDLYVYDPGLLPVYAASLRRLAALGPSLSAVFPAHDASPIDPAMLPRMVDGVDAIIAGRSPDWRQDDAVRHIFDGFAVRIWGNPLPSGEAAS